MLRAPDVVDAEFPPEEDSDKLGLGVEGRREGVVGLGLGFEMDCSRYSRERFKRVIRSNSSLWLAA